MNQPRFRIAWVLVAVAIIAIDFAIIRAMLDHPELSLAVLGLLPMVSVLVVVNVVHQQLSEGRPFLFGFEVFGVAAMAIFLALMIAPGGQRLIMLYLAPLFGPLERLIGSDRSRLHIQISYIGAAVMLGWPQFTFALLGGFLSRRYTIARQ
jgi:hypothetical protein